MENKKTKLTISGNPKKSYKNFEPPKNKGRKTVIIEKIHLINRSKKAILVSQVHSKILILSFQKGVV